MTSCTARLGRAAAAIFLLFLVTASPLPSSSCQRVFEIGFHTIFRYVVMYVSKALMTLFASDLFCLSAEGKVLSLK